MRHRCRTLNEDIRTDDSRRNPVVKPVGKLDAIAWEVVATRVVRGALLFMNGISALNTLLDFAFYE